MKEELLVSVIIPAFNCEEYILESIESIISQSYSNLEILVCDDASDDRTWSVLKGISDSRLKLFQNNKNEGVVPTKNFLLAKSQGEFIVFQDADDWSHPLRVEKLVEQFTLDQDLSACASDTIKVNSKETGLTTGVNSKYIFLTDCPMLFFIPPTLMIKRRVYDNIGGFNIFLNRLIGEDLYWISLISEKYKFLYLDCSLYFYRFNVNSLTNSFHKPEKLVAIELIIELINQRIGSGQDWLSNGDSEMINHFISSKLNDPEFLAEQYRLAAARLRDGRRFKDAISFIAKAIWLKPLRIVNYRTLRYVIMPF